MVTFCCAWPGVGTVAWACAAVVTCGGAMTGTWGGSGAYEGVAGAYDGVADADPAGAGVGGFMVLRPAA